MLGEREAQYELYQLYSRAMFNTACRITGNEMDAEDVLQDSFVSAFKHLHGYKGNATFGSWLKRIVVNNAINLVRKRKIVFEEMQENHAERMIEQEAAELLYDVDQVRVSIDRLPEGYRMVLSLYLIEGYDHKEIAQILDITESTSKSQLNRAKKKLKELVKEELQNAG